MMDEKKMDERFMREAIRQAGTSIGLDPSMTYSLPIFSSSSLSTLYKVSPDLITPEQTFNSENFPINGSTIVLKTCADFGMVKS